MSQIEEGCLAMVVKSFVDANLGKVVTVGKFIGDEYIHTTGNKLFGKSFWEVSEPLEVVGRITGKHKGYTNVISESQLMRIDGFSEDEAEEVVERLLEEML